MWLGRACVCMFPYLSHCTRLFSVEKKYKRKGTVCAWCQCVCILFFLDLVCICVFPGQTQHLVFRAMAREGSRTVPRSPGRRRAPTSPIGRGRSSTRGGCHEVVVHERIVWEASSTVIEQHQSLVCRGTCLHRHRAASRAMEKGMLPGKLRHWQQGGDGHGMEAIAIRSSSSVSESSTRCVIVDNMVASHRRVAALVANTRQRACRGGTLVVKA